MSVDKCVELFESNGFLVDKYYTIDGYYRYFEIVSLDSAFSILIAVPKKHKISSKKLQYEFELIPKDGMNEKFTQGVDEPELRQKYRSIDYLDTFLQNESGFVDLYDRQISIKGEENKSINKFATLLRQMKRFKLCFRTLEYKPALFDGDCMVIDQENKEQCYFISNSNSKKRRILLCLSMESFYKEPRVAQGVKTILSQFYEILNHNQQAETTKIQNMLEQKRNILTSSKKILEKKKFYLQQHAKLTVAHEKTTALISSLKQKIEMTEDKSKLAQEIQKQEITLKDLVRSILETTKNLDELALSVDTLLFDNMTMLAEISNNFRHLEELAKN